MKQPVRTASLILAVMLLSAIASVAFTPQLPEIDRASVERVIGVLASDDMAGRDPFAPSGMRAAEFIADEFEGIGLEMLPGRDGYLQGFGVFNSTTESCSVTLDGAEVATENFACSISSAAIDWSVGDAEVFTIGAGEDPRGVFNEARGNDNAILLIDSSQAGFLQQMGRFFSRGSRSVGQPGGSNLVAVVTDDTEATSFRIQGTAAIEEMPLANVAGMIPGNRTDEFVLFSAHYDHVGVREGMEGDNIFNGANDDASGTTAVIELARYFKSHGKPERTLLFVAFTAEESGGYGSRYFSEQLDPDQIVAMFNIEMIGKPAVSGPDTAWITGYERSSFGEILSSAVEGTVYEFYADPYPEQNLFFRSDNATLARLGVPAHSISTTPIDVDPDYHQASDEVETLDLDHMTNTIRAIAMAGATIISGEATPTRVDPESVRR